MEYGTNIFVNYDTNGVISSISSLSDNLKEDIFLILRVLIRFRPEWFEEIQPKEYTQNDMISFAEYHMDKVTIREYGKSLGIKIADHDSSIDEWKMFKNL